MELRIAGLSKTYPNGVEALKNVDLTIPMGMFGLLGPNGAGKSSLMRTLATLQEADTGTAHLGDIDMLADKASVRKTLGYLPQEVGLYPKISAINLLDHFAVLKGITHRGERKAVCEALLKRTNLWDHRKKKLGTYSGGMRRRFGIAVALLGDPKLIIVDEPTAGLDPAERERFHNLLAEIGESSIVILSTHIVDDVSNLCERLAVLANGEIVLAGSPDELVGRLRGTLWITYAKRADVDALSAAHTVLSTRLSAGRTAVRVLADTQPEGFEAIEPTLEDVYFAATTGLLS